MRDKQDKFFICGNEDVTALVFKANAAYRIVFEDEIQYMVRDEMGEINYLTKNDNNMRGPLKSDSGLHLGKVLTREQYEATATNGEGPHD